MTKVVHCKKEQYDVLIDRTTKWGNPFKEFSRAENCQKYYNYLLLEMTNGNITKEDVLALDGKTLGCWCSPKQCHGDEIVKVINEIKWGEV